MNAESENRTIKALLEGMDMPGWKLSGKRDRVLVFSIKMPGSRYIAYKTVSEYSTDIDTMTSFLGDNITTAMSMMNHRYVEGSVTRFSAGRIVRTAFSMPPGFRNRDFVHSIYVRKLNPRTSIIAYGPVSSALDLPGISGFVRCPMWPSGQRITWRGKNRIRVEHLMVYGLAGLIPSGVQNLLFHKGHVKAYLEEWNRLKQLVRNSEWKFGNERAVI